jgi:hypothetical protein
MYSLKNFNVSKEKSVNAGKLNVPVLVEFKK